MHFNQTIFDRFKKEIEEINGKYVIVAHSLGSAISTKFIDEKILLAQSDKDYNSSVTNNFTGIITSGDINNTFLARRFARDVTGEKARENEENLLKYFSDNGKFWISYNHRNDLFASSLAPKITSYKNLPDSGIISITNQSYPFQGLIDFLTFNNKNSNIFQAHQYMFVQPKSFARGVLRIYKKHIKTKVKKKKVTEQNE